MPAKLSVIATPIGNLEDITLRALRTLKEADFIAAEDTRHTAILLNHYEIRKPMVSYHQFNEAKRSSQMGTWFDAGKHVALVSDAGFPGISDPGERLISHCIGQGVEIEIIPGPSAVLHALATSGMSMSPFTFKGFLPVKAGQRSSALAKLANETSTTIFFESPHRVHKTLCELARQYPKRAVCVAREMTKKFEEILRGTANEIAEETAHKQWKGEITLVIAGVPAPRGAARMEPSENEEE
jgi:16S rRNA (cytidine1402-2'-O)-methyltransferase